MFFLFVVTLLSISVNAQNSEQKSYFKKLLNAFCNDYYSECFSGRHYVSGSITVISMEKIESKTIRIRGNHDYLGYLDVKYTMEYYADIYYNEDTGYMQITFNKLSKNLLGPDYWESCSKEFD